MMMCQETPELVRRVYGWNKRSLRGKRGSSSDVEEIKNSWRGSYGLYEE